MDMTQALSVIEERSARLVAAAERGSLAAPVPSCPGWDVAELLRHIGSVQRWSATMVERRIQSRLPRNDLPPPPPDAELVTWVRAGSAFLVKTLREADPAAPMWTWLGPGTVSYWARRQAHEVLVHAWDAQDAHGIREPMEPALAADGVDELLTLVAAVKADAARALAPATVHLHCSDVKGEWLVHLGPPGMTVERIHKKGDVAAVGPAQQLLLHLWGRLGTEGLTLFGDAAVLARFRELTAL